MSEELKQAAQAEREAFDAWATSLGYNTERDMFQRDMYQSTLTWDLWRVWQARASLPTHQQATSEPVGERWVVVRETALDVGRGSDVRTGGRPELGYALVMDAATFDSEDAAVAAIKSASLPVGWVVLPLSRLLPDLAYTRPAPGVPEGWREVIEKMVKGIDHLAELARQWEPDYSSGADRKGWVLAKNARDEAVDMLAAAPTSLNGGKA